MHTALRPALRLGSQATAWEGSPGRSLCLTKSSARGRLWQFAHPRPLSLLQRGLAPRSKGKARAELYLPGILPFFKIHVNQFLAQDDSPAANVTSRHVVGEGPGGLLSIGSHGVEQDLSDLPYMHPLEKEVATHSSVLAWRIPGTGAPGGLRSTGSHRVRHNRSDLAAGA